MTLACEGVCVRADGRMLLDGVSAVFQPGRLTAILGPNGAGKSTLMAVLSGQRQPDQGQVRLSGLPVTTFSAHELALRRAVMPQESAVAFDFVAREVVELGRYPHRRHPDADEPGLVRRALAATDTDAFSDRIFNTLSGGEKARVQLSRALAQLGAPRSDSASRWLLLDEPTAALDLAHQHASLKLLRARTREEGVGVVAILHDLNLALRYADDVLLLAHANEVCFGDAAAVLTPDRTARIWGVACTPITNAGGVVQYLFEPTT